MIRLTPKPSQGAFTLATRVQIPSGLSCFSKLGFTGPLRCSGSIWSRQAETDANAEFNAWVDQGVVPLVSALNEFDCILTLDSCEGKDNSQGYVYFAYRGNDHEAFAFICDLSTQLGSRLHFCCDYRLRLEWMPGAEQLLARIVTHRDYVSTLAGALGHLSPPSPKISG
jgi:hypothetical protein